MKRRVWSLIKSQLNVGFGISQARFTYFRKRERLWEAILIPVSIAIAAGSLGFGVFKFFAAFHAAYASLGQGDMTLLLGVLMCQFVMLALGFTLIVGNFYYATDLQILIPLPFRPWEVLAGKLALLLAGEYAVQAVFFLPVLLAYGLGSGTAPVPFGLAALAVFLVLPLIPLTIAAVPAVLLMQVLGGSKRRDALLVAAGFLFVVLIILGQFYIQDRIFGSGAQGSELMRRALSAAHGLTDLTGRMFPPAAWAARALADPAGGLLHLLLFLAVSAAGLTVFFTLGEAVFYQGALRGTEAGKQRRRGHAGDPHRGKLRTASPVASLARVEALRFARTPVYVLNGFIGFILFPILFLALAAMGSNQELAKLFAAIRSLPSAGAVGSMVVTAYFALLAAMTTIPFTPFSREGRRNIWIPKSLPIPGQTMARAKVRGALLMIVPGALPGVAALAWAFRFPWPGLLGGMAMGLAASYLICCAGVALDLARPMLDWISQEKAVKSNLNTMIGLGLGFGMILAAGFGVAGLFRLGLPGWAAAAILGGVLAVLACFARWSLPRAAERLWGRLEV